MVGRIPNPNDPNLMTAESKAQLEATSTTLERIQRYTEQLADNYENLPVELKLAAMEHLMQQNEAEFMHYIEYLYADLQQLHGDLRSQVERRQKQRSESKILGEQRLEAGLEAESGMDMEGYEADEDKAQVHEAREGQERRSQPEANPEKKMAFGRQHQLERVERLLNKMQLAMGMQPKFNPTPMR